MNLIPFIPKNKKQEAAQLDKILSAFCDDGRHHKEEFGEGVALDKRFNQLIKDGYIIEESLCHFSSEYSITSLGKMYCQSGGYSGRFLYEKLKKLQLWFGIITFIIAVWGFIRTL